MIKSTVIAGGLPLNIIDNLLSPEECTNLIERADQVQDGAGNKSWHMADTDGMYMRVVMVDQVLADVLFSRIKEFLPDEYRGLKIVYLNSHFRFSKYDVNGNFPLHRDGTNYDSDRADMHGITQSLFTLNIFLNDDYIGGETEFFSQHGQRGQLKSRYIAKPQTGRATLFFANQWHRGNTVLTPYKYLLRTDVMTKP
jgi:predicted 2-oxoglutarate/Fe(II)-dependent dioxygenase YbiX